MSTPTQRFRDEYRAAHIPPAYQGWLQLLAATFAGGCIIFWARRLLSEVGPLEWLTVPLAFFVANGVEYFGHRHPMHRAMGPLKPMCVRHAGQHHRFFTHRHMVADSHRDFHIVLFPLVLMTFFFGAIATPIAAALFFLVSTNVGALFVIVAVAYALTYEWLHLSYHLRPDSFLGSVPFVERLRRHHLVHHDPGVMAKANFNITFPIFDAIMGTKMAHTTDEVRDLDDLDDLAL